MGRMRGEEINGYEERTKKWLTSHEYRILNQERYIGRSRTIDTRNENEGRLWEA
jgi:hypothetical protein